MIIPPGVIMRIALVVIVAACVAYFAMGTATNAVTMVNKHHAAIEAATR